MASSPINGQPTPRGKPFTSETAREARRKRTEKDRAKVSIVEPVLKQLGEKITAKDGTTMTVAEGIARQIIKMALSGNKDMINLVLALLGETPAAKVEVSAIDPDVAIDVEKLVKEAAGDVIPK